MEFYRTLQATRLPPKNVIRPTRKNDYTFDGRQKGPRILSENSKIAKKMVLSLMLRSNAHG
jgi:hypothetical protein